MMGKLRFFRLITASMLVSAVAFAGFNKSARPAAECSQQTQGIFWPPDANHDPMFLQAKASAGDLWLCRGDYDWDAYFVQTVHFFKWQQVTVHVEQSNSAKANGDTVKESLH